MKPVPANPRTLARALNGVPPDGTRGRHSCWTLQTAIAALDGRRSDHAASNADAEPSLMDQRRRLTKYKADIADMERRRLAGELIPAIEIEQVWSALIGNAKVRLRAIPAAIAGRLAVINAPAEIQSALARAIDDALEELATTEVINDANPADYGLADPAAA